MNDEGLPDLPDEGDVKKRQVIIVVVILILVGLTFGYIFITGPGSKITQKQQGRPVEIDFATPGQSNNPIQNWVLKNETRLKEYETDQAIKEKESDAQIKRLFDEIKQLRKAQSEGLENAGKLDGSQQSLSDFVGLPLPSNSGLPITNQPDVIGAPGSNDTNPDNAPATTSLPGGTMLDINQPAKIIRISFAQKNSQKKAHIRSTIPAGTFGKAVLLAGLDAPTGGQAERNPHPVLLEMLDNSNLPNRYRHRVQQCRLVGSGMGNISDERAYIRLERLTCVLRNGDIISEVATGTVTGEDGKNGMRGNLVTKQGALIANAFLAGSLSGIGSAISQSYTTVSTAAAGAVSTLDPGRTLEAGVASGVGTTMEKMADWYFKRAEETYPIIEISAGRVIDIFLTEDLPLNANLLANFTPTSEAHDE